MRIVMILPKVEEGFEPFDRMSERDDELGLWKVLGISAQRSLDLHLGRILHPIQSLGALGHIGLVRLVHQLDHLGRSFRLAHEVHLALIDPKLAAGPTVPAQVVHHPRRAAFGKSCDGKVQHPRYVGMDLGPIGQAGEGGELGLMMAAGRSRVFNGSFGGISFSVIILAVTVPTGSCGNMVFIIYGRIAKIIVIVIFVIAFLITIFFLFRVWHFLGHIRPLVIFARFDMRNLVRRAYLASASANISSGIVGRRGIFYSHEGQRKENGQSLVLFGPIRRQRWLKRFAIAVCVHPGQLFVPVAAVSKINGLIEVANAMQHESSGTLGPATSASP
mmetsp:Transcript_30609/g.71721  ORF Transcript_30609/g.71721 Transcript_30609/m.71721 type:complete len:332 (-) Transcript_30609:35-1030(-)